jgi:hypothetical protein
MVRKKTIPLSTVEVDLLKHLYLAFGYPSDQYKRRPTEKARFVRRWNNLSERSDSEGDLLHFVITKRKNSQWVTFDGNYKELESMPDDFLSPQEWTYLEEAYIEVLVSKNLGSDNIAYDPKLAQEIGVAFARRSARAIHAPLLLAAIEEKRKRGNWVKLTKAPKPKTGFDDWEEAAGM